MIATRAALSKKRPFRLGIAKSFVFDFAPSASSETLTSTEESDTFHASRDSSLLKSHSAEPTPAAASSPPLSASTVPTDKPFVLPPSAFSSAENLSATLDELLSQTRDGVAEIWVPAKALSSGSFSGTNAEHITTAGGDLSTSTDKETSAQSDQRTSSTGSTSSLISTPTSSLIHLDTNGLEVKCVKVKELSPRADNGTHLPAELLDKMSPHTVGTSLKSAQIQAKPSGGGTFSLASRGLIKASANADVKALSELLADEHPDSE